MSKYVLLSALVLSSALSGLGLAQGTQTVTPQQFIKTDGIKGAYTVSNNALQPADALSLIMQCTPPMNTMYDRDHSGRNDTLRTYGFAMVNAEVYRLRGPAALSTALQKAQLRAQGAAAEFFAGVRTSVSKSLDKRSTEASGISNNQLQLGDLEVETLRESVGTNADAVLRYGHAAGTRLVSLGQGGLCVVIRYELPLDQRPRQPGEAPGAAPAGAPMGADHTSPAQPGYPPIAPGSTGDF